MKFKITKFDSLDTKVLYISKSIALVILSNFFIFPVVYTERPFGMGKVYAKLTFFYIKIKKSFKNDESLLLHEIVHLKQVLRTFFLHFFLYNLSSKYHYKSELEAYSEQVFYIVNKVSSDKKYQRALLDDVLINSALALKKDMENYGFNPKDLSLIYADMEVIVSEKLGNKK